MSKLQELMDKYGEPNKEGWFNLDEKKIVIPVELREYMDIEDGKLVRCKEIPEELQDKADELERVWAKAHEEYLTEY